VDLVTSTFYQKREQAGTAEPMKQGEGISQIHSFTRTFSVVKELTVLNYREAVSFSLPIPAPAKRLRYEKQIKGLSQSMINTLNSSSIEVNKGQRPSIDQQLQRCIEWRN